MRIALLTYSTRPRGGVVHTLALAEALAALGEDVTVFAIGRGNDLAFFRTVDVPTRIVPIPDLDGESVGARVTRSIAALRGSFDPAGFDIVHAQDCISANAVGRCIRTVHHIDHFTTPQLLACHERALREPFAHVCVSAAVAAELRQGWGLGATVIPNGVESQRFAAAVPRADLGRYLLAVGGIEPRKGSLDLLAAYAEVVRVQPDVRLVIAGGETLFDYRDYRRRWEERATALGIVPTVLGPVAHDDLPGIVAGAAAFAFPSTKEGFGLAAMEALAAGIPVVTRDLPVFREVFGDSVRYGTDSESLATALIAAMDSPDENRRESGRALAARHTWKAAAEAHRALYRVVGTTR